jgi:hypothetical protein
LNASRQLRRSNSFMAYDPAFLGGIYVGVLHMM